MTDITISRAEQREIREWALGRACALLSTTFPKETVRLAETLTGYILSDGDGILTRKTALDIAIGQWDRYSIDELLTAAETFREFVAGKDGAQ